VLLEGNEDYHGKNGTNSMHGRTQRTGFGPHDDGTGLGLERTPESVGDEGIVLVTENQTVPRNNTPNAHRAG
jgi:hypothetical protein